MDRKKQTKKSTSKHASDNTRVVKRDKMEQLLTILHPCKLHKLVIYLGTYLHFNLASVRRDVMVDDETWMMIGNKFT